MGAHRANDVLNALPGDVKVTASDRKAAIRDEQVRVFWGDTPIDLFFEAHDFHREIAQEIQEVPFEGTQIPVLGCETLVIFKAMFNRTRDWGDIEAVLAAGAMDCGHALERLRPLLGAADPAVVRLAALCDR